ncbi:sulfur carrier protein ThiS [Roseovarius sp. EL26]|uniref:sulfur carrier protein ThiS n=1 Tax=Roseovarius sp. EL26 TaxID=2126672 RepID=UPI000EA1B024|nr:sulfur carrier protein ThiS [Roseovarius sp. EL26]
MHIIVNAQPHNVSGQTLDQVLPELGYSSPAIATALNGVFIANAARASTLLSEGDRIEILAPMQGG